VRIVASYRSALTGLDEEGAGRAVIPAAAAARRI
jgi:hypothetical protein